MQNATIRTILTITGVLIGSSAIAAPLERHPEASARVDARIEAMAERLDLSEAQQQEIRSIIEAHHEEADLARQEMQQRIDAVLTDDQRSSRDTFRHERLGRHLRRMSERLGLSDDQRDAIRAILEEGRTDPGLTPGEIRQRIAAVLTPEQQERLSQWRRHRGDGRGRGWRPPVND